MCKVIYGRVLLKVKAWSWSKSWVIKNKWFIYTNIHNKWKIKNNRRMKLTFWIVASHNRVSVIPPKQGLVLSCRGGCNCFLDTIDTTIWWDIWDMTWLTYFCMLLVLSCFLRELSWLATTWPYLIAIPTLFPQISVKCRYFLIKGEVVHED